MHCWPLRLISFWLCWMLLGLALASPLAGHAQGIETIMAPGKLVAPHARYEEDCKQCHVKFDRKAQSGQCMACHKEVGADVRGKTGYHGRLSDATCNTCHTDHKGREAHIVQLDPKKFDHTKTDYELRGKHEKAECAKCHVAGKKHSEASHECSVCHKKDDKHKGALGSKCADCHSENGWKEVRFDHDATKFPLTGKHTDTKCVDCHKDNHYKDTPRNCYACHKKADEAKGHKGQFGEKCDSCHTTREWKPSTFNHDTDTKYQLKAKHRSVVCKDCHTGNLYKDKLSQECYSCHKKDDKHKETLGTKCESCHTEKSWKEANKFDHDLSSFPLKGKHAKVECKDCHKSALYKEAPKDCVGCHKKDDKHKDNLGPKCESCHSEQDWKNTQGRFDHARTKFPLRNGHAKPSLQCNACHKDLQSFRNTPLACFSCHKKDDKHQAQLGEKCDSCHNDKAWKGTSFDHGQSRFPLTGSHVVTDCKKCHETLRYKDAPRDCFSCHKKDDKHKSGFGMRCDNCHNSRAWLVWSYDHDLRTKFRLDGAHAKVPCATCHKHPAPAGKDAAPLGTSCVSCHRSDDAHNGAYGQRCETCHRTDNWKKLRNRPGNTAGSLSLLPRLKEQGGGAWAS
jgi:hypothetical protein